MSCTRKHTLVTGASSGIGRATALRLAADGQHVYAGVRHPADGEKLASSATNGEVTPLILDVTDASHIAAAAGAVAEHTGAHGLDGLVNNAGIGLACPAELLALDMFRRLLEINVVGQLAVTQALLPSLRRARGPSLWPGAGQLTTPARPVRIIRLAKIAVHNDAFVPGGACKICCGW
jgi:NAD(P)-dependent dehydrogenase (short-subunit alcohol dehydrogenase family)